MKTRVSKLNILLIAVLVLLIFAMAGHSVKKTGSWLTSKSESTFTVTIKGMNLIVSQETGGEPREIVDGGNVYVGTKVISADTEYDIQDVKIKNGEAVGTGYYIRFKVSAIVNANEYDITSSIISSANFNYSDGYYYLVEGGNRATLDATEKFTLIDKVQVPTSVIGSAQGKLIKLSLIIEGHTNSSFA